MRGLNLPQTNQFADQIDATITTIQTNGIPATPNPDGTDPLSQLTKLANGASELHRQLTDPNADYRAGINKAADGAGQLSEGLHKLSDGSQRSSSAPKNLPTAPPKLAEGSEQLTSGARQLADGLVTLDDGMGELSLKLNESAQKVPAFADGAAKNFSTPVAENTPKDSLGIFGMGLTPMFISIGLFLGATVTFMLLHPRNRRAIDSGAIPLRAVLAAYLPAAIVGLTQATIMFLVQRFALGLTAINELGLWLSMCLIAVTFITITQGLNNIFGVTVGRVLCLALMTLQIVSSGGLYPPETQPAPLRWFHTIDPMTYSVNLLRRMIFGTEASYDHRAPPGTFGPHHYFHPISHRIHTLRLPGPPLANERLPPRSLPIVRTTTSGARRKAAVGGYRGQLDIWPVWYPAKNASCRCSDVPCVNVSGRTSPPERC